MRHDSPVDSDLNLNGRWSDWAVWRWDGSSVTLIADLDLTYHHEVEVTFVNTEYAAVASSFWHPTFRGPTSEESATVEAMFSPDAPLTLIAWDAETANGRGSFLVACEAVRVSEGSVVHDHG